MNKRNLQKELENIIKENEALGKIPKLLLHACCAPCSSYCMEYLNKYFDITVFFYNPNIDLEEEYKKRVDEEKRLIKSMNFEREINFLEGRYEPEIFHALVKGHEKVEEGGIRCHICYEMRLREAAIAAKAAGFEYFTTALSISPMKDSSKLCDIGESLAKEYNIKYLPSDFKKKNGYKRAVELSYEYDLYRQDYCGCSYSKANSINRRSSKL